MLNNAGHIVTEFPNKNGSMHVIDKLDPIMLAGFSERWSDGRNTALWEACIASHYSINFHHQQNPLWSSTDVGDEIVYKALLEMYCDKCSRALQKNVDPLITMWEVKEQYYQGVPNRFLGVPW